MLSQEQIGSYHNAGFTIVKCLLRVEEAKEWKATLRKLVQDDMQKNNPDLQKEAGVRVWFCDKLDPISEKYCSKSELVTCLNQIVGKDIEFLSFKAVFKDSTTSFPSPWHQDWHYWKGTTKISIWIALDDADESNGCLKLVPGSHKDVVHMDRVQDGMGFIHRISSDERMKDYPIAVAPLSTGDAIFFHDLTIHASCPNINGEDRWAAIATYRDASLKDESPIWSSSIVLSGESVNSPLSSNI